MPFKVTYNIWDSTKAAPIFSTSDKRLAQVELEDIHRKRGFLGFGMVPEVTPVDLTSQERYVWLVYRVRKAIRRYFDRRGKVTKAESAEDLNVSLALERKLDNWNARTRCYLDGHPKASHGDPKAFAFFEVVEEWRIAWHKYHAYKKLQNRDKQVEREMKKQCFDFESAIDGYVTQTIGI